MTKQELLDKYGHLEEQFRLNYSRCKCIRYKGFFIDPLIARVKLSINPFDELCQVPLELNPLSSISDEHAEHLVLIKGHWGENKLKMQAPYAIDYLRSKSYLLPFMGITVEELIIMGWAKYKEG